MRSAGLVAMCAAFSALAQSASASASAGAGAGVEFDARQAARYWTDPGQTATAQEAWQQLQRTGAGNGFVPRQGATGANFGFTDAAIWLALPLPPGLRQRTASWVLSLDYPPLDDVQLFVFGAQGQVLNTQRSGDARPFMERALPVRLHAFELPPLAEASTLMLRVRSGGILSLPVDLQPEAAFWRWLVMGYVAFSLYFGLVLGLVVYNALLGVQLRDTRFAWYCAFGLSVAGLQATLSGLGMQYLWPQALWWQDKAAAVFIAVACGFALQFTRFFLDTRQNLPRTDVALRGMIGVALLCLVAALALPLRISTHANSAVAGFSIVMLVATAAQAMRQRVPNAGKFSLAWAALLVGAAALLLHNNALIATSPITHHGLLIGSALEMVLLSLCLGSSMRQAQREREQAEARAEQEHALVQSLRNAQARNESLLAEREATLNNAVVGMVLSVARKHVWVNDKFVRMMGYERSEMIGRTSEYLYADRDEWDKFGPASRAGLEAQGSHSQELRLRKKDGGVLWAHMAGALVKQGDFSAGVIWTILDVTALRQAEEQTRAALVEQQELTAARERFVAVTSHELRTPVASILGTLELFEHYGDRLGSAEKDEMLKQINRAAQRLWGMTERVLLHGKAQAGQLLCHPQEVALRGLLAEITQELWGATHAAPARLQCDWPDEDARALVDPSLLRHILHNLLGNAFKYSGEVAPVQFEVRLNAQEHEQSLVLRVRDSGIGIPADEHDKVFQGFRRGANVGEISGTGLGLSIVKHCVLLHGGRIDVDSAPGKGSCFTVVLPQSPERP